jgi:ABC-type lipoprotein release transport system permease subunit
MQGMLFGVGAWNPGIFAVAAGVMVGVVFFALFIPARRAAHVNPTEALRAE